MLTPPQSRTNARDGSKLTVSQMLSMLHAREFVDGRVSCSAEHRVTSAFGSYLCLVGRLFGWSMYESLASVRNFAGNLENVQLRRYGLITEDFSRNEYE